MWVLVTELNPSPLQEEQMLVTTGHLFKALAAVRCVCQLFRNFIFLFTDV